jgi:hypothetical protein
LGARRGDCRWLSLGGWPGWMRYVAAAQGLARQKNAELVTGDPELKAVEKEIKVHWLP